MEYETRMTKLIVLPRGEPIFAERATAIEIDDEGEGEYVRVSQTLGGKGDTIAIDVSEWPHLRAAIDRLIAECRA